MSTFDSPVLLHLKVDITSHMRKQFHKGEARKIVDHRELHESTASRQKPFMTGFLRTAFRCRGAAVYSVVLCFLVRQFSLTD